MKIESRIRAELAELESRAQLRHLNTNRGVDLGSNDYLGLGTNPIMAQAVRAALSNPARMASGGSRLLSGHDQAWTTLESDFARWVGAEAALYFTSGYAANLGLLSAVLRSDDIVFSDSANHASLIDGMRLSHGRRVIFPHLDLRALGDELQRNVSTLGARFIVVESIFSMEGDRAPLAELYELAARYDAELIVDEAHAIGVIGPRGAGCVADAELTAKVFATVHTCGKALASAGAFVCGSESLKRFLINRAPTFIFSTALPPYFASQVAAGISLAIAADGPRNKLAESAESLRSALQANGFDTGASSSHIVPVILGSNEMALNFASRLQERGYGLRAIRPPTVPPGTARLRLSLTSNLTEATLADFVSALVEIRYETSLQRAVQLSR